MLRANFAEQPRLDELLFIISSKTATLRSCCCGCQCDDDEQNSPLEPAWLASNTMIITRRNARHEMGEVAGEGRAGVVENREMFAIGILNCSTPINAAGHRTRESESKAFYGK